MGSYMKSSLHIKYTLKTEPGYDTWKSNSVWKQWLELRHEGREALGGPDGKNSLVRIKGMGWEGGKCTAGKIESRGVWTLVEEMCVLHEADRESQWGLFCLPQALGVPSVARQSCLCSLWVLGTLLPHVGLTVEPQSSSHVLGNRNLVLPTSQCTQTLRPWYHLYEPLWLVQTKLKPFSEYCKELCCRPYKVEISAVRFLYSKQCPFFKS